MQTENHSMLAFTKTMIESLQSDMSILISVAFLFGLIIGSFLNVVIYRLPKMMETAWNHNYSPETPVKTKFNLATPSSRCAHCNHHISATENIPLISYVWLKGKCRHCKTSISFSYPLIELLSGLSIALIFWQFGYSFTAVAASVFVLALITLTMIDLNTHLLPDIITLPLLWLGLLFNLNEGFTDLPSAVIGAATGYLLLWFVYWCFKLVTKKEGMGYGDFKMLAAIGAWFGWQTLPASILISALAATLAGSAMIVFGQPHRNSHIPFGPFIAISGILLLFFRPQVLGIYLG
jgi:leader peptidase (prepilin peptidase) / N-methyltransferase